MAGLWSRLRRRPSVPTLDPDRDDLVVVASCFDDAEAASVSLERARTTAPAWDADAPAVLRHHLVLPADAVADAVAVAAQDGYAPVEAVAPANLVLRRVQVLDALHCAQESSRMAGLAQRRDGRVLGWDALQPPAG